MLGERARAILAPLILRRTKDSKLEGDPILQLKPKTIELVTLEFSPDERDVSIVHPTWSMVTYSGIGL